VLGLRATMLFSARKSIWLCLSVAATSAFISGAAFAGPNYYLKGLKIISYSALFDKTVGGNECKIDLENLNTSLQFIANQSTGLRIVTQSESEQIKQETHSKLKPLLYGPDGKLKDEGDLNKQLDNLEKWRAAAKTSDVYTWMPHLFIGIQPLQVQSGCAGTIHASLSAVGNPTQLRATQADVSLPSIEIWFQSYGFVAPQQNFSSQAINPAEQIMKQLVNDWVASQELP
jgi:hypothetical protein